MLRSGNMDILIKAKSSKLDPFEEALFDMEDAKKTLTEMRQWLAGQGVTISVSGISQYLSIRRQRRERDQMLEQIATGQQEHTQLKAAFVAHPEPDLETMIKLSRFIMMQQAMHVAAKSDFTRRSCEMTKMVLNFIKSQVKMRSGWD